MKILVYILIPLFSLGISVKAKAQKNAADFYRLEFYEQDGKIGFYDTPLNQHNDSAFNEYLENMFGYLTYLIANYSDVPKMYADFEKLLPDSNLIKNKFLNLINKDESFNNLVLNSYYKKPIPDLPIDSLIKKVSRFYYAHLTDSIINVHLCAGINGLYKQEKNIYDQYYNAFAFNCIYNDFGMQKFSEYLSNVNEINQKASQELALKIQNKIYEKVINDPEMKKHIIAEYESKKSFLNFKLIY